MACAQVERRAFVIAAQQVRDVLNADGLVGLDTHGQVLDGVSQTQRGRKLLHDVEFADAVVLDLLEVVGATIGFPETERFLAVPEFEALCDVKDVVRGHIVPSFSYKRDSDIKGLYGKIKKIVRDASVQSGLNELESLKLTLKKYVPDLQRVREGIESVSKDVLDFLKSNAGPFSKHMVNFDSVDIELIYTNLANRIYANRNAIAHSKESDSREKFIPYKHDNELLNEVLLIRIVAEEVIINSSKGL